MKIVQIYKEYVKERKLYVIISILISLRLEPFSTMFTFFLMMFLFGGEDLSILSRIIGYIMINSIVPMILGYKNLKRSLPYIKKYSEDERELKKIKKKMFIINYVFFSLTLTILITFLGKYLPFLAGFDMVRVPLSLLGCDFANKTILGNIYH